MNFDILYYDTLTPLVTAYRYHAGAIFGAAFIIHCVYGSYLASVAGAMQQGFSYWKTAVYSLLVYTIFYVPVPHPGQLVGFRDDAVNLSLTQCEQTTAAIFLMERLSYGFDELALSIVGSDASIRAQSHLAAETLDTPSGARINTQEPNSSAKIYNFLVLRYQFLQRLGKNVWNNPDLDQKGVLAQKEEPSSPMGTFDLLKSLSSDQWMDYLVKQLSAITYNLLAFFMALVAWLVIALCGLVVLLLAGVVKYVPVLLTGVALFLLPFSWMFQQRKGLLRILYAVMIYLPLKAVIVLVLWLTFFMVEAIILQGYYDLTYDQVNLREQLNLMESGWIYTPSGAQFMDMMEATAKSASNAGNFGLVLVSLLVALLSMVYVLLRAPGLVSRIFGRPGAADDLFAAVGKSALKVMSTSVTTVAKVLNMPKGVEKSVQVGKPRGTEAPQ